MSDQETPTNADDWLNDVEDTETVDDAADETITDEQPKPKEGADDAEQPAPKTDEDEPVEADPTDGKPKEDDPTTAKETEDAEAERKRHNDEMAKQRIQQKNAVNSIAQAKIEQAKSALEDAGDDETKRELADIKAREAERDARDFVRDVEHNQSVMQNQHAQALSAIPMFRETNSDGTPNPDFNAKAYELALQHLAPHLITQQVKNDDGSTTDVILGSDVSVYDFLTNEAASMQSMFDGIRTSATLEGQRAEQKMQSRSEPGNSSAPKQSSSSDKEADEMADAFAAV